MCGFTVSDCQRGVAIMSHTLYCGDSLAGPLLLELIVTGDESVWCGVREYGSVIEWAAADNK